jgi:hypothetical protein
LRLLLHHDDAEREFAYDRDFALSPLAEALDHAADYGIRVVSMKDDWATVFPTARFVTVGGGRGHWSGSPAHTASKRSFLIAWRTLSLNDTSSAATRCWLPSRPGVDCTQGIAISSTAPSCRRWTCPVARNALQHGRAPVPA